MSDNKATKSWVRVSSVSDMTWALACALAITSSLSFSYFNNAAVGALAGLMAAGVCGYAILSLAFVAIDRNAVAVRQPLRSELQIAWAEVRYVLTDRKTYAFIGNDKALAIQLSDQSLNAEMLRMFINDLTRARGIPVMQTRTQPTVKTHNVKA